MSNYPDGVTAADIDKHFGNEADFNGDFEDWCIAVDEAFAALPPQSFLVTSVLRPQPRMLAITECDPFDHFNEFEAGEPPAAFAQSQWEFYRDEF